MNLCRYYYDVENFTGYTVNYGATSQSIITSIDQAMVSAPVSVTKGDTKYFKYPAVRLASTSITEERYFKAVAIPGIGYWKLPNDDIFPAYTISGINIGTGDGVTTTFENPLCYFKKDTEKIYKNGVQLTRDTDYTINNIGNKLCLPEVAEIKAPVKVTSNVNATTTLTCKPLFWPSAYLRYNAVNAPKDKACWFNNTNPLYIEYEEEVTFNCLKCTGGFKAFSGTNGWNQVPAGTVFYIDASTDGETYVELGSWTVVEASNNGTTYVFNIDFEDTTAKYWRFRTSYTSYPIGIEYDEYGSYPGRYIMLSRKDPDIVFTEAPADGDVITMDVDMDLIMKNGNFVVDIGCKVNVTV